MARRRNELDARGEALFTKLAASGGTGPSIAAALKAAGYADMSQRTVGRRLRDLRGKVAAPRLKSSRSLRELDEADALDPASLPKPDAIPEDATPDTYDRWIETAERMAKKAEKKNDLAALGAMGRLVTSILEAKRKATPPKVHDPNEDPDMIALGEEVAVRFHKLIDQVAP